jgi:hypothetical protein
LVCLLCARRDVGLIYLSSSSSSSSQPYHSPRSVTSLAMFDPFEDSKSSYQAIRKHSAAHDVYNRLHSIAKDTEFVKTVSKEWYDDQLVVIRELRCPSLSRCALRQELFVYLSESTLRRLVLRPFCKLLSSTSIAPGSSDQGL